jgi:serine protease AprX
MELAVGSYRHPGVGLHRSHNALGRRAIGAALVALLATTSLVAVGTEGTSGSPTGLVSVIVREMPKAGDVPERVVEGLGGDVGRTLAIIDGFVASVPPEKVDDLRRLHGVRSVTPNASVQLLGRVDGIDPNKDPGSWLRVVKNTKLHEMWQRGWTGKGIDVALIDSGVAPVEGLTMNVINGPDLSFESQAPNLTNVDTYGHGTHLAGLIAGRDAAIPPTKEDEEIDESFVGAAPGARIVSLKVSACEVAY